MHLILFIILLLFFSTFHPFSNAKLVRVDAQLSPKNEMPKNGTGTVQELQELPDSDVQIGTKIRKIEFAKRIAKRQLLEEQQNDDEDPQKSVTDEVVVDEGEAKRECKTSNKSGTSAATSKAEPKGSPKSDAKAANKAPKKGEGSTESPTTVTTTTVITTAMAKELDKKDGDNKRAKDKDDGEDAKKANSGASSSSATEPKAKGETSVATVPQGPPMPPPPPPQAPQQSIIVSRSAPKPAASGMALPMPSGVGGKLPNYKLIYFDARGICEPIRLLFHFARVPFDDVRISRKQWLALKDSTVYGKVPILEVDGKPLTYCHTIARYLARSFGLAGRDNWEQAKVDEISDFHADVAMDLQPYMYVVAGFHQGDKHSLRNSIFLPNVEKHFPVYVSLLKQSNSGFLTASGITWVDFVISEYMTTVRHFEPQILDKYPAITKFIRKVQTQPQIFDYVSNREHSPI